MYLLYPTKIFRNTYTIRVSIETKNQFDQKKWNLQCARKKEWERKEKSCYIFESAAEVIKKREVLPNDIAVKSSIKERGQEKRASTSYLYAMLCVL